MSGDDFHNEWKRRTFISKSILGLGGISSLKLKAGEHKPDPSKIMGEPVGKHDGYGQPSEHVRFKRSHDGNAYSARSKTPLQDSFGIITPSGLHFERHHAGIPQIDPQDHKLAIFGQVKFAKVFKMEDLYRYPSTSGIYFIECSGNNKLSYKKKVKARSVQETHGLMSCSEWTGVKLSTVLEDVGVQRSATWMIAEGGDASRLARSIPIDKCWDDALLAYAQNGEPIRPEQGYPLRLVLPGWEGNTQIKWLKKLYLTNKPFMTQQETSKYTDLLPSGKARQFSFEMGTNSVITSPSGTQTLTKRGFCEIRGLAWSGKGKIKAVEVSVDGGQSWALARLHTPILKKCHTRFSFPWVWQGGEHIIQSRSIDEFGHVQPDRQSFLQLHGSSAYYHMNAIHSWKIKKSGEVVNVHV